MQQSTKFQCVFSGQSTDFLVDELSPSIYKDWVKSIHRGSYTLNQINNLLNTYIRLSYLDTIITIYKVRCKFKILELTGVLYWNVAWRRASY